MSSVFKTSCFLFLRDPRGGVEDLDKMQAAGFDGVFCNIGDHAPAEWEAVVRPRALQRGMFCGPWARTQGADGKFSEAILSSVVACAEAWGSPLIVNSESELKGTGSTWTPVIAAAVLGYDAAVSVEPQPFADVDWYHLKEIPVLPQVFGLMDNAAWYRDQWHGYGVDCCFYTFGSYDWGPSEYELRAPFSLYTGDDCGQDYAAWSPTSFDYVGCVDAIAPPNPEDDMQEIGKNDGVAAEYNALRDLDPSKTLLVKDAKGKWPSLDTIEEVPLDQWKAWDKGQRSKQILVDDHDDQAGRSVDWDDEA
jgi:hypothetical protein